MPSPTVAIVVAVIAALASLGGSITVEVLRRRSVAQVEQLKDDLAAERAAKSKAAQAAEVMATYRNPLARSVYDLQSRLYNIHSGFRGGREMEYFRNNTLFVLAEFLGWLEIVRQEIQFLDADAEAPANVDPAASPDPAASTRELQRRIDVVRDTLAERSRRAGTHDDLYVYRGHQRAIGELMIVENPGSSGPAHACRGYASFVDRLDDPTFVRWFVRLGQGVLELPDRRPVRVVRLQRDLIDLLDALDRDHVRFPDRRDKIDRGEGTE